MISDVERRSCVGLIEVWAGAWKLSDEVAFGLSAFEVTIKEFSQ